MVVSMKMIAWYSDMATLDLLLLLYLKNTELI